VPARLTAASVQDAIELGAGAMARWFGAPRPRIGVLGLNPHAGEGGLFGREEIDVVAPAIEAARARLAAALPGAEVVGPLVPDAAYRDERIDLFVALYHDQGLIPVKLLAFGHAVNVTLGLPFVRTSVDHGTGFDIVDKGVADGASLLEALKLAAQLTGAITGTPGPPS
jgi:4-hydroxythreonine-4-phosphate dehydrogenase